MDGLRLMAGVVLASGTTSVTLSDDLNRYVENLLGEAVPTLRPAMERLITEAMEEIRDGWPGKEERRKFEQDKKRAIAEAKNERRRLSKQGKRIKEISFWDFMPNGHYRPPGYRATGASEAGWRVEIRLESGPTLVAAVVNNVTKQGARYAFMAKLPPPQSNKTYLRLIAIPAIKSREKELIRKMSEDLARLAGGT